MKVQLDAAAWRILNKRARRINFLFQAAASVDSLMEPWVRDKRALPVVHLMVCLLNIGHRCSRKLGSNSQESRRFIGDLPAFALAILLLPTVVFAWSANYFRLKFMRAHISSSPGSFLCKLADFLCSRKTKREIADPIIADMQFEYYEALFANRRAKAAWIRVRGCCAFFQALGLHRVLKGVAGLFQQARPR